MSAWEIVENWWNHSRETLSFRLVNQDDGRKAVCGITQEAINDYFETEDTPEQAESNFADNEEFIVEVAIKLIENSACNDEGQFIISSATLGI